MTVVVMVTKVTSTEIPSEMVTEGARVENRVIVVVVEVTSTELPSEVVPEGTVTEMGSTVELLAETDAVTETITVLVVDAGIVVV
jgi:hypothetical protein